MITVKADDRRRIMLPGAKPKQVFRYLEHKNGTVTLTPVEPEVAAVPSGAREKRQTPPRVVTAKLVRKDGQLVFDIPKGLKLADGGIPRVVRT